MPLDLLDPLSLAPLFRPASIAVIGASTDPSKLGTIPLVHMKTSGFKGALYPINPRAPTVQDIPAFPGILAVPGPVDLAIISLPEAQVAQAMRDCARKGVRAIVLFTSGFAEIGEAGARAQEEIKAIARTGGMRLLGPNCMGLINFANGVVATFHPAFGPGLAPKGRIGLITQSGAFGGLAYQVAQDRALAYSLILTTGNEGDVDVADGIAYLADDPETAVIMLYIEGCRDGQKLAAALARARARRKPVICLKVGRTEAGIAAVASHTAALAGADEIFDAMFRQHGVYRCDTMEEFFDIGYAAAQVSEPPAGRHVGIITVSGGVGVLMADSAAARGLEVTPAPQTLQDDIRAMVPFAATRNPIDVTGQVVTDMGILERTIELTLAAGFYESVACFIGSVGRSPVNAPRFAAAFPRLRRRYPESLLAVACYYTPQFRAALDGAGCLVFDEPTHALRAIAALSQFRRGFDAIPAAPAPLPAPEKLPPGPCDEATSLAILARAGLPVVPHRLVRSAAEAGAAAKALGLPVALKIVSPDITHKTDLGGVALNLATPDAVRRAFDEVTARVRKAAPLAALAGCLVAPMVAGGVETILGAQWYPVFGSVVMLGLGGIFVEALKDVTFRVAPFDQAEARRMIAELRALPVLHGMRGRPPADLEALARALAELSRFAAAQGPALKSLDVNPFLVLPEGQGALALDAVLLPA
ncbi:MAG: acetate--CoA ligase family protein [Stellaceae bacterium]